MAAGRQPDIVACGDAAEDDADGEPDERADEEEGLAAHAQSLTAKNRLMSTLPAVASFRSALDVMTAL